MKGNLGKLMGNYFQAVERQIDWPHAFAPIYKINPKLALALLEINHVCHCQRNDVAFIAVQGGVWVIYEDGLLRWISNSRYE